MNVAPTGKGRTWVAVGPPAVFGALAAALLVFFLLPLFFLVVEVSPRELGAQLGGTGLRRAVLVSLASGTLTTGLLAVAGVAAGYWLARSGSRAAWAVRAAILLPTVLPPVAAGVLLLNVVGPGGIVGRVLEGSGWTAINAFGGIVLAQLFVAAPFVVLTSEAAFRSVDPVLEAAAATLGATRTRSFRRVALPLARHGVLAGLALGWMRAVGEFGATVVLAYHPHSLPVYLWVQLTGRGLRAALPVALVALLLALAALAVAQRLVAKRPSRARAGRGVQRGPTLRPARSEGAAEPLAPSAPGSQEGPVLRAALRHRVGEFRLEAELEVGREVLSLFGPSGAGKSTLLRLLAGLERPESGRIVLDGAPAFEDGGTTRGARPRHWLPAHRRPVGMVFQSDALFPHLTVEENVAFAAPDLGAGPRGEILAVTRLGGLEDRLPSELSGGQRQRAALARALARRPRVLLLDEPFSSLDGNMREQLHRDVGRIASRFGLCVVYVTHDLRDACSLGDRLAVMTDGRIAQVGSPLEVLRRPSTYDVARFVGVRNLVPAAVVSAGPPPRLRLPGGLEVMAAAAPALRAGGRVHLCVRPEDVVLLKPDRPLEPPADENVLAGRVVEERLRGASWTLTWAAGEGAGGERLLLEIELPVRSYEALRVAERKRWRVSLRRSALHVIPEGPRG